MKVWHQKDMMCFISELLQPSGIILYGAVSLLYPARRPVSISFLMKSGMLDSTSFFEVFNKGNTGKYSSLIISPDLANSSTKGFLREKQPQLYSFEPLI